MCPESMTNRSVPGNIRRRSIGRSVGERAQQLPRLCRSQRGLGLPTAIFVITVMAFLAVAINQLVESNAQSAGEELLLIRAFYAAESGIQLGLNQTFPPVDPETGACPGLLPGPPLVVGPFTEQGLAGCSAQLVCETTEVDDSTYYTLRSTGSCGAVRRTIQVRAR